MSEFRERSSSREAQAAEEPALAALAALLSSEGKQTNFVQEDVALDGGGSCRPDGVDHDHRCVVEVYARQGPADFGAHVHKIARDVLKLKLLSDTVLSGYQPILLFTSEAAAASYLPGRKGWISRACASYGIEVRSVTLDPNLVAELEAAQERQDITRGLEA